MNARRLVLATGNAGKLREFDALLAPLGLACVAQRELGVGDAPEPHATFLENALEKARHAARATGLPALADDSGLCVDALEGAPGVRSARFATDAGAGEGDSANNAHLLHALAARPHAPRTGRYCCVLVLVRRADDPLPLVAQATWEGEIAHAPRGVGGFGYDPLFLLPDRGVTVAELDAVTKNAVSHRGRAMARLAEALRDDAWLRGAP